MDPTDLPVVIEPMQLAHLPAVMEIERESFSLPWPESSYRHELTKNDLAHYFVLCPRSASPSQASVPTWKRLWQVIWRRSAVEANPVWGYGGFWLMYDEAHISNLAVKIAVRRHGLGELLLIALLDEAQRLDACRATLEVRISNVAAQRLYTKYGFKVVGQRKAYYSDNREDALILTTPEFASRTYQGLVNAQQQDLMRRLALTSLDKILQMH